MQQEGRASDEEADRYREKYVETIRRTRTNAPLQCQIDETGYLKDCKSGTYVFDVDGNLFQLSQDEIALAINSKIIVFS